MQQKEDKLYNMSENLSHSIKIDPKNIRNQDEQDYRHLYEENKQAHLQQGGKKIYQEYQMGYAQIENQFSSFKNAEIIVLHELKQQYQILKNLPINDKLPKISRLADSLTSSGRQEQSQISLKQKRKDFGTQFQLLMLQKKQMQVVMNSNMKKIESLLLQQMQNQNQIHHLKVKLEQNNQNDEKYKSIIKSLKRNEQEYEQNLSTLKRYVEKYKNSSNDWEQKMEKLQNQIKQKDLTISKLQADYRKIQEQYRNFKDKKQNQQISIQRFKKESDIIEKQLKLEIQRLKKQNESKHNTKDANYLQIKIKTLQQEIQLKDKRYYLLLDKFITNKDTNEKEDPNKELIESRHKINQLKAIIDDIKIENKSFKERFEKDKSKIYQANFKEYKKMIDDQNLEKIKFMKELKKIKSDYQLIIQQNKTLKIKFQIEMEKQKKYKFQIQRMKRQLQMMINSKEDSLAWNKALSQNSRLVKQIEQLKQDKDNIQNRNRTQMQKLSLNYEEKLNKKVLQMDQIRQKFQIKVMEQANNLGNWLKPYEDKLKIKESQNQRLKKDFDKYVSQLKQKHQTQLRLLMTRLQSVLEANQKFMEKNQHHLEIQTDYIQLKKSIRNLKWLNESVDHLWQIKEAQYGNVNQILQQIKR